jgi:molybdate transport system regulatory protein
MPSPSRKYVSRYKPWLELQGHSILGEGRARLLQEIRDSASIRKAAEKLDIPYRSAWEHLRKIEEAVGTPVVQTFRGGARGGGGAALTEEGERILHEYERYERYLEGVAADKDFWEALYLKVSTRNQLPGTIKKLEISELAATVRIQIETPTTITALITRDAVDELELAVGDEVEAVIKSTEVMVAKE